ncbi:MAG: hypothetical protein SFU99_01240 [Saprospiraceae bacterium]|nr:hypothetical protein [Saprospiraceae bacterium]
MERLQYKMMLVALALFYWGCQAPLIERPDDPFRKEEPVVLVLDFDYRETNSSSGFVQFSNLSNGYHTFQWSFGFLDANGKPVTSDDARPYVFFPANGEYLVILTATDVNGKQNMVRKYILIKNKCC